MIKRGRDGVMSVNLNLQYGMFYSICNGYNGTYLDTYGGNSHNLLSVSTSFVCDRDKNSGTWCILSASNKSKEDKVCSGDLIHLQNEYPADPTAIGGYLDTCGRDTRNLLAVSTSSEKNRDSSSGTWRIMGRNMETGTSLSVGMWVYLVNQYPNGGYLDTCGTMDKVNSLAVSTSATQERDAKSTHWAFIDFRS